MIPITFTPACVPLSNVLVDIRSDSGSDIRAFVIVALGDLRARTKAASDTAPTTACIVCITFKVEY